MGSPRRVQWMPLHPHFFLISPLGWRLNGHSKGDGCTQFGICFLTDDFSCSSSEGGLQRIEFCHWLR